MVNEVGLNRRGKAMMHYGAYEIVNNNDYTFVMGAAMGICAGLFGTTKKKGKRNNSKNEYCAGR